MLALLCTAPQSTISSPIEDSFASSARAHPSQNRRSASPYPGSGSSSSRKPTPLGQRRPSIRKRIQSFSRVSGASLDKATASLSNAAGSSFSFLRHSSGSGSSSSPSSSSAHVRGASTSSFASGKSAKSSSSSGLGNGRPNILNISPPSAFKHQFHVGPDTRTSAGPWDESRWRDVVEMRTDELQNPPVIDVVSSSAAIAVAEPPRVSTSSERNLLLPRSHSERHVDHTTASASSPNLLSHSSPSSSSADDATPSASADGPTDDAAAEKAKAARTAKRASLVKRKPVPPLYPEEASPLPSTSISPPAASAPASYVLMPDPTPAPAPETVPAGRTSFDVGNSEASEVSVTHNVEKVNNANAVVNAAQVPAAISPAHVCVLHAAPPPTLPPRRHTLAHMQARALGRGIGESSRLSSSASQTKTKRTRPAPIISPSPTSAAVTAPVPAFPPGLPVPMRIITAEPTEALVKVMTGDTDNSPRPSFSSLVSSASVSSTQYGSASSTTLEGAGCANGSGSSSGSESGELETEPRTPTDERRVSAGSAASMSMKMGGDVTIVLSGALDDDDEEEEVGVTPKRLRRVSKRPNPPVRRVEANEESVYVTADEAEEGV